MSKQTLSQNRVPLVQMSSKACDFHIYTHMQLTLSTGTCINTKGQGRTKSIEYGILDEVEMT